MSAAGLAACGGSSPGLVVLGGDGGGRFDLHCGVTAIWEAGVVGNTSNETAVVRSVRLQKLPAGFGLGTATRTKSACPIWFIEVI